MVEEQACFVQWQVFFVGLVGDLKKKRTTSTRCC